MAAVLEALPKNADAKLLNRSHTFFFGGHKGKTVGQLLEEVPSYILWAQARVAYVKFPVDILEEAEQRAAGTFDTFKLDLKELEKQSEVVRSMVSGLDSYGSNGVRQLHGLGDNADLHATLNYFLRLAAHLIKTSDEKKDA